MKFYGVLRNLEASSNCFVGEAAGEHLKHFAFARRKRLGEFRELPAQLRVEDA